MMSYYTNIALSTNFLSLRIFFLINKAFQDMTTVRIGHQESTSHTFVGMTDLWVRIRSRGREYVNLINKYPFPWWEVAL